VRNTNSLEDSLDEILFITPLVIVVDFSYLSGSKWTRGRMELEVELTLQIATSWGQLRASSWTRVYLSGKGLMTLFFLGEINMAWKNCREGRGNKINVIYVVY
jgi:hypothetical protein